MILRSATLFEVFLIEQDFNQIKLFFSRLQCFRCAQRCVHAIAHLIYRSQHKFMPKNFQDYLGNKVIFLKWEDNGLLLANFIEFFCRVLILRYYNKFRKLIAKYSNDLKDYKGYKPKRILPFASVMLPLGNLNCNDDCFS